MSRVPFITTRPSYFTILRRLPPPTPIIRGRRTATNRHLGASTKPILHHVHQLRSSPTIPVGVLLKGFPLVTNGPGPIRKPTCLNFTPLIGARRGTTLLRKKFGYTMSVRNINHRFINVLTKSTPTARRVLVTFPSGKGKFHVRVKPRNRRLRLQITIRLTRRKRNFLTSNFVLVRRRNSFPLLRNLLFPKRGPHRTISRGYTFHVPTCFQRNIRRTNVTRARRKITKLSDQPIHKNIRSGTRKGRLIMGELPIMVPKQGRVSFRTRFTPSGSLIIGFHSHSSMRTQRPISRWSLS